MILYEFSIFEYQYWLVYLKLMSFFIALPLVMLFLVRRKIVSEQTVRFIPVSIGVGIIACSALFYFLLNQALPLKYAHENQGYRSVEGRVAIEAYGGNGAGQYEVFSINGKRFSYHSHQTVPGYRKYAKAGGVLVDDWMVRVSYVEAKIVKVEKLKAD